MKVIIKVSFFLCALLLVGGCGGASTSPKVVKIGVLFPLSGDLASTGEDNKNGVLLAVEEINTGGGIAALDGARLELVIGDTQGDPDTGAREAERLIEEEQVVALIGTYQSSVAKTATQVAERLETPFLVSMGIADIVTERGFRYTFRVCPKAEFYGRDQVRFLSYLGELGYPVKRVALLHENTDFGTATALAQQKALQAHGLEVVVEVSYEAEGVADLTSEVSQVLAAEPDAILQVSYLQDAILIAQALTEAGARLPMVDAAGGTMLPEFIQELGPRAEDALTLIEFSKYAVGAEEVNARFHARFGTDLTGNSAHAYQTVLLLQDALERAASTDKEKLRQALAETDLPAGPQVILPAERLRFGSDGQSEFASLFVAQIQGGELIPIWPPEMAAAPVHTDEWE
jgi:branched-chain amino acid transport system substrate-binding protein